MKKLAFSPPVCPGRNRRQYNITSWYLGCVPAMTSQHFARPSKSFSSISVASAVTLSRLIRTLGAPYAVLLLSKLHNFATTHDIS